MAICGASAALAISAVLPKKQISEQDTLLTVVGVTTLSTLAMIIYPVLFGTLGLTDIESGLMIGATIHDVAQVVGAGYSVSEEAGDLATVVKLLRVAMLPVVLIVLTLRSADGEGGRITLPWFLVAFIGLMLFANFVTLPPPVTTFANDVSRWLLLVAVSALGVKTSLGEFQSVGKGKMLVIVGETLVLLALALAFVMANHG